MSSASSLPPGLQPGPDDALRRERLVRMQRVATGLLVVVAVLFVVARQYEGQYPALGYLRAFAEAAMVGGIADWFAVTALFRHPMGVPIPHTAIVPARKDRIGQALGQFVQRNFLAADVVREKLTAMQLGRRAAEWLVAPGHSAVVTRAVARTLATATQAVPAQEVESLVDRALVARLRAIPAAPVASRVVELASASGIPQRLLDDVLQVAVRFLDEHEATIRGKLKEESPWWVPGVVENRLGNRLVSGIEKTLAAVVADPAHPLRERVNDAIGRFHTALRENPELIAKAESLKLELLAHPAVGALAQRLWADASAQLGAYAEGGAQATSASSELPRAAAVRDDVVAAWVQQMAQRALDDPAVMAQVDAWLVTVGIALVDGSRDEVAALIASTVASWDAEATSRKIELQIGRDLQFIRINGTLVGGVVGVLLHLLATHFSA